MPTKISFFAGTRLNPVAINDSDTDSGSSVQEIPNPAGGTDVPIEAAFLYQEDNSQSGGGLGDDNWPPDNDATLENQEDAGDGLIYPDFEPIPNPIHGLPLHPDLVGLTYEDCDDSDSSFPDLELGPRWNTHPEDGFE